MISGSQASLRFNISNVQILARDSPHIINIFMFRGLFLSRRVPRWTYQSIGCRSGDPSENRKSSDMILQVFNEGYLLSVEFDCLRWARRPVQLFFLRDLKIIVCKFAPKAKRHFLIYFSATAASVYKLFFLFIENGKKFHATALHFKWPFLPNSIFLR